MTFEQVSVEKYPTGIAGLDRITGGGLPKGQATFLHGGPGSGKTVLCLQIISNAIARGEGGVLISFEEGASQICRDAASFKWGEELVRNDRFMVLDARQHLQTGAAGDFDVEPLLKVASEYASDVGATWVVIDGIDQLLLLYDDPQHALVQMRHINEWSENSELALILTGKSNLKGNGVRYLSGVEFMLPVVIRLDADFDERHMNRYCMVRKYRGSSHSVERAHVLIDDDGIRLPLHESGDSEFPQASAEKLSIGSDSLDQFLDGGLYRGSVTLISGKPGTAKSTIAASFALAACKRKERVLYMSFDEDASAYMRNLASVGYDLQPWVDANLLRFVPLESWDGTALSQYMKMSRSIEEFDPTCLVIDSVSAMLYSVPDVEPREVIERLLVMARKRGITSIITAVSAKSAMEEEAALGHVSTVADTWLALDYNVRGGERNRSLSIVKFRGSKHSNQQRELILGHDGIRLAEVYEYGSEVLMGTARAQKQLEEARQARLFEGEYRQRMRDLEHSIKVAESDLQRLTQEYELQNLQFRELLESSASEREFILKLRGNSHQDDAQE